MAATKLTIILAAIATASCVNAEGLSTSTTVGFGNSPYKDMESDSRIFPLIQYESDSLYFKGPNLGLHVVNTRQHKFNVFVGYSPTNFNASHSSDSAIKRLDDRYTTAIVGAEYTYFSRQGIVSAKLTHDILDVYNAPIADVSYGLMFPTKSIRIIPKVGLRWSSSGYNDYYFGISTEESSRSGLTAYQAGSSVTPYVNITAIFSLSDHLSAFTNLGMQWLPGEVTDSPMVGEDTTYGAVIGLSYSF